MFELYVSTEVLFLGRKYMSVQGVHSFKFVVPIKLNEHPVFYIN